MDPDPSAGGTSGMPQDLASGPGARHAPFRGPSEGPLGWRRSEGSRCASWVGRPPAERARPCFRPRRPTRAERAAAANFHASVSAVLYSPIHLNWVQIQTRSSLVLVSLPSTLYQHYMVKPEQTEPESASRTLGWALASEGLVGWLVGFITILDPNKTSNCKFGQAVNVG